MFNLTHTEICLNYAKIQILNLPDGQKIKPVTPKYSTDKATVVSDLYILLGGIQVSIMFLLKRI